MDGVIGAWVVLVQTKTQGICYLSGNAEVVSKRIFDAQLFRSLAEGKAFAKQLGWPNAKALELCIRAVGAPQ